MIFTPQSNPIWAVSKSLYIDYFGVWNILYVHLISQLGLVLHITLQSLTFQHIWKRKVVSMLCLREAWMCFCWVCLLLSLRLDSVWRASRVGHSQGQRSAADELVTVAERGWRRGLLAWSWVPTDGWSSGVVTWMCLADVVLFWDRRVLPPSRIVCFDPRRSSWTTVTRPMKTSLHYEWGM